MTTEFEDEVEELGDMLWQQLGGRSVLVAAASMTICLVRAMEQLPDDALESMAESLHCMADKLDAKIALLTAQQPDGSAKLH